MLTGFIVNMELPGVMKSNGRAITVTNKGIKEVLIMKNFRGIFDAIDRKKVIMIRITRVAILLAKIATTMKAVNEKIFALGSIF